MYKRIILQEYIKYIYIGTKFISINIIKNFFTNKEITNVKIIDNKIILYFDYISDEIYNYLELYFNDELIVSFFED